MKSDRIKLSDRVKPSYVKILSYSPLEKQRKAIENRGRNKCSYRSNRKTSDFKQKRWS